MTELAFSKEWIDEQGHHAGGVSQAPGVLITWQRGPLIDGGGRNGAFVIEVLEALLLFIHPKYPEDIVQGFGFILFADTRDYSRALAARDVGRLVIKHLDHFQSGKFSCQENETALLELRLFVRELVDLGIEFFSPHTDAYKGLVSRVERAIAPLVARRDRRKAEGTLGTHKV